MHFGRSRSTKTFVLSVFFFVLIFLCWYNIGLFLVDGAEPAIENYDALDDGFDPVEASAGVCAPPRGFWTPAGCPRDLGRSSQ